MNVNNLKKTPKRFGVKYLSRLNIQGYGDDNLYPQRVSAVVGGSSIGGTCLDRYAMFIEGAGFDSTALSQFVCNRHDETLDDILHLVCLDMAKYNGFALHVNYNAIGEIVEVQHVNFEDTRLEEEDDNGYVAHIMLHPDWTGCNKTRNGKTIKVDEDNVKKIFPFNPNRNVVLNQIAFSGGVETYKGQILWFSMDGKNQYPKPIYDKAVTAMSTDEGIDNALYRNVRNNFMPAGAFIHKKGTLVGMDENGNAIMPNERDNVFGESLNTFLGDTNAASIMDVTYENEEDKPEFLNFCGTNFDNQFTTTSEIVKGKIYAAFQQEVWRLIDAGKIGFGGQVLKDAYMVYNSFVSPQRRAISRAFCKIFDSWAKDSALPEYGECKIQPLVLITEEETTKA